MADDLPGAQPVPLGDLEIAERIARAARGGRPADRSPTLGQLLMAFAEPEPTEAARRRVAAALAMAGVSARPDLMTAGPDQRVALSVAGMGPPVGRIVLGAALLAAVIAGAVLAATLGGGSGGERAADQLPLESGATTAPVSPSTTAPPASTSTPTPTPTATATTPEATTTSTVGTTTSPAAKKPQPAGKGKRGRRAAASSRLVSVRLAPSQPTFLCAKDGAGRVLFAGTLSAPRRFRARRVRLNVGLGPSTRVTVNGRPLALGGSPAGYDITRSRRVPLGTGARPEC